MLAMKAATRLLTLLSAKTTHQQLAQQDLSSCVVLTTWSSVGGVWQPYAGPFYLRGVIARCAYTLLHGSAAPQKDSGILRPRKLTDDMVHHHNA